MLIERDIDKYKQWKTLIRDNKSTNLSVRDVVNKYQGFEGEIIKSINYNGNQIEFQKEIETITSLDTKNCILLHVISENSSPPEFIRNQALCLGYDVGICDEEQTVYSSIFHEILFGHLQELTEFKSFLNDSFLFSDKYQSEKYIYLHNQLSLQGKDVEDYMQIIPYSLWKQSL